MCILEKTVAQETIEITGKKSALAHLRPFPGLLRGSSDILLHAPKGAHEGANTDAADHVYGYTRLNDGFEHTHVGSAPRTASTKYKTYRGASQPSR